MAQMFDLHDKIQLAKLVMYGIWRKRWYGLVTAWVICLLSWSLVLSTPYTFRSQAIISIDSSRILPDALKRVRTSAGKNTRNNANLLRQKMITAEKLERIIQRTDFLERLATSDVERARLTADLTRQIRIRPLAGADVYEISYQNNDSRLSAKQRARVTRDVVMLLLNEFSETRADEVDNSRGLGFYRDQIAKVTADLEEIDLRESEFVSEYGDFLGNRNSFRIKIEQARGDLTVTQNELGEKRAELTEVVRSLKSVPETLLAAPSLGGRRGEAKDPLEERIADLEKDLDKLKISGKTDKHPDVVSVSKQISDLKTQLKAKQDAIRKEQEDAKKNGTAVVAANEEPNPLHERLMYQKIQLQSTLKRLETRETKQVATLEDLESKQGIAPEIQNRYDRLDLEKTEKLKELRKLRNQLNDLEQADDALEASDASFTIRQPPTVPAAPSSQARIYFFAGGLLFSMIAGIAVALVFSVIRPTIISVEQLRGSYDLPILGSVTMTYSDDQLKTKSVDLLVFGGSGALLFLVFVGLSLQDVLR